MNDDIVTRLRTTLAHADDVYDTMDQAANEIERLRALVHRWETCDQVVDSLCGWDSARTLCRWCRANGVVLTHD